LIYTVALFVFFLFLYFLIFMLDYHIMTLIVYGYGA
jgi:hypothetical protein